jgi:hypothetical protein
MDTKRLWFFDRFHRRSVRLLLAFSLFTKLSEYCSNYLLNLASYVPSSESIQLYPRKLQENLRVLKSLAFRGLRLDQGDAKPRKRTEQVIANTKAQHWF